MIVYSADAEPARAYLLRGYNDIDIFVEDVLAQNMYVRLFSRILEGIAKISQVFPLQSRANVLAACSNDQGPRNRKRIYVIDADQDLILGIASPSLKHFYRLSVYSSENLLLSESAALQIAMEASTSESWTDLAIRLRLRDLLENSCKLLIPLYVSYALIAQFQLTIVSVSFAVQRLFALPNEPTTLSEQIVQNRILQLRTEVIRAVGRQMYRSERNAIVRRLRTQGPEISRYISGKSSLLPILHLHLVKKTGYRGSMDSLKVGLASHCELTIDPGLAVALRNEC